ncbi:AsnC family transcriptional regulator [Pseudoduganella sp. DS3]|uniref:AsnC family transcriptional regulator n=1 Tax=Pseudoduganella guangdongensis TaxID=2692179 RepID=A0A6N9HFK7_9BURK|nr:Lrp/AsnC family transcriptional regulator [Pseudoduganella guangdongensis]MYN02179.1 AsnC family transcriptional regulator [Pseudoduganella guangdongensis]
MDKIDREIIELLRDDARISFKDLGERVSLSANTVADRVRRLVAEGAILAFEARVDHAALGLHLQAYIDIKLKSGMNTREFEEIVKTIPGVLEVALMTGNYDGLLRVACRDQAHLLSLIDALRDRAGVQDTYSRVILHQTPVRAPLQ